eukprot:592070-Alexandrium_andersonii.AAC.1
MPTPGRQRLLLRLPLGVLCPAPMRVTRGGAATGPTLGPTAREGWRGRPRVWVAVPPRPR